MKNTLLFLIGILSFSFIIGLMVGASNSPVVGGVLTSVFAATVSLLSLFINKSSNEKVDLAQIGACFIFLSIGMLGGIFAGIAIRAPKPMIPAARNLVWTTEDAPQSTYEALDWIITADYLQKKGFTEDQIRSIYQVRQNELILDSASHPLRQAYTPGSPYYKMLTEGFKDNITVDILRNGLARPNEHRERLWEGLLKSSDEDGKQ